MLETIIVVLMVGVLGPAIGYCLYKVLTVGLDKS